MEPAAQQADEADGCLRRPQLIVDPLDGAATRMTAADVRDRVLGQIGNNWDRSNLHKVDLRTALVEPPQPM